jgi:hypothetical protein|nr:hypothetical protein [Kofleriaceae bacterium]
MREVVVAALLACGGCYLEPAYVQVAPGGQVAQGGPPAGAIEPPPAVDVFYDERPGYVYVNGRYGFANGAWAWHAGYYMPERRGYVYVQGSWSGNRWIDGRWEPERPGYVHTGGGWEARGRGYAWRPGGWEPQRAGLVYVRGGWAAGPGGTRTWSHGRWIHR